MDFPVLSTVLLAPLIAAFALCFVDKENRDLIRKVAAGAMIFALCFTLYAFFNFDTAVGGVQFAEKIPWVEDLGVCYSVGVDGISMPLLLLSDVIGVSAVYTSWNTEKRAKEFFILLLLLIAGVTGTFIARDLFIFLLSYELFVIPVFVMVLVWGSTKRLPKEFVAMKFIVFLLMGSAFMLVGVVLLYVTAYPAGERTFDFEALRLAEEMGHFSEDFQIFAFPLLLLGFGSLLSMFPFHSWSPDGHAAAPTAVSMIHAGILKKLGAYGLIRVGVLLLPLGAKYWSPLIVTTAVMGVLYAAYIVMAQKDLKYIIGYSSVSHMGYILLGIMTLNAISVSGAVANMVAHGMMTALFFSQIGYIYERTHLRSIPELRGLAHYMPHLTIGFMLAGMTSLGLPGLIEFLPEFTIFVGTFGVYPVQTLIAIFVIVFTALYVLRLLATLLFGPKDEKFAVVPDEQGVSLVPLLLLGLFIVGFGLFPSLLMNVVNCGIEPLAPLFEKIAAAPTLMGGVR